MKSKITLITLLLLITGNAVCQITTTSEALPGSVQQRDMKLDLNNYKLPQRVGDDIYTSPTPTGNTTILCVDKTESWHMNTISKNITNYSIDSTTSNMPSFMLGSRSIFIHSSNMPLPMIDIIAKLNQISNSNNETLQITDVQNNLSLDNYTFQITDVQKTSNPSIHSIFTVLTNKNLSVVFTLDTYKKTVLFYCPSGENNIHIIRYTYNRSYKR